MVMVEAMSYCLSAAQSMGKANVAALGDAMPKTSGERCEERHAWNVIVAAMASATA